MDACCGERAGSQLAGTFVSYRCERLDLYLPRNPEIWEREAPGQSCSGGCWLPSTSGLWVKVSQESSQNDAVADRAKAHGHVLKWCGLKEERQDEISILFSD